jgi:hypothetical protein
MTLETVARAACVLAAAVMLSGQEARAARFGVPPAGGADPPGYFILTSQDAFNAVQNSGLGDTLHALVLYIEVPTPGLRVNLYDPGLFSPSLGPNQLDLNLGTPPATPATLRFQLFGPDGSGALDVLLRAQDFGPDDVTTNRRLVSFYDDPGALPGLYHLVARMIDGVDLEQDVTAFGVEVPGRNVHALNITAGELNEAGATIAEPLRIFPWVVTPNAGNDATGPICGIQLTTFDMDAPGRGAEPPFNHVTSTQGFAFPPEGSSGDAGWHHVENGGVNPGALDSSDHGAWAWDFDSLSVLEDVLGNLVPPRDINCFAAQMLDLGAPDRDVTAWTDLPTSPPFIDFNPAHPRRLYLPADAGGAPVKESLNQSAQIVGGYPAIALGETSTLEVTLTLDNPNAFPLVNVRGTAHVSPDVQITDPVSLVATGGLVAVPQGGDARAIDLSGLVPPLTTATVTFRVDITPTALGQDFLTGDGGDFIGGTRTTVVTYDTPYTNPSSFELPFETLGPICQIEYTAVLPTCLSDAQLSASALQTCPGKTVTLDASASQVFDCPGGVPIYQWRVNGAIIFPFPDVAMRDVTPFLNDTWEIEVACSTDPTTCTDTASVTFDLYPSPIVDAGADAPACAGDSVRLVGNASGGSPPYSGFTWATNPPGQPGDGATTATIDVAPTQDTTYTLTATDAQGCTGSDDVLVDITVPDPAISPALPAICPGQTVDLSAAPGFAAYLWTTTPAGRPGDGSTSRTVTADEVGVAYEVQVTDSAGCKGTQSVTIGAAPPLAPGIQPANPAICPGGTVLLTADPGYAGYRWDSGGAEPAVDGATTPAISVSVVGATYSVTVTDASGCTGSAAVTPIAGPPLAPGIQPANPAICPGGAVLLTADPGYASYRWDSGGAEPAVDGATTPAINVSVVGATYSVTVRDAAGCTGSAAVTPIASPPLAPGIQPANPELCPGGTVALTADAGYVSYLWSSGGAEPAVDGLTTPSITVSVLGATYTVTVRDAAGCTGSGAVTTAASADPIPAPMNWSLRLSKSGTSDLRHEWQDLPDPASGYRLSAFDCTDAGGDGICDVPPTRANIAASASFVDVPVGAQASVETDGLLRQPPLMFYKVRALSPCSGTPGPFAVEPLAPP